MTESTDNTRIDTLGTFSLIPLNRIAPDHNQPRKHFDEGGLNELADSIRDQGVIQPIVVRPKLAGAQGEGDYDHTIVSGERRWRAAEIAGLAAIPAIIRPDLSTNPEAVAVLQLVENLQRADLTLYETAIGCRALAAAVGLSGAADKLGKSKPWVSQRANLFDLDPAIVELVNNGKLTSVDVAHDLNALSLIDDMTAGQVNQLLEQIANGDPPTREHVRVLLQEAREDMEAAADARSAAIANPNKPLFSNPDDDFDEDDADSKPTPKITATSVNESPHERERRLREEAWTELMPDCRKLAREARKAILKTLDEEIPAAERSKDFEITISQPMIDDECPAKATGAHYYLDVRGSTTDAGLVIEALTPKHKVILNTLVTIAQLRQIEALLGYRFPVRTTADYGGAGTMPVRGALLSYVDAVIRKTAFQLRQASEAASAQAERIVALVKADEASRSLQVDAYSRRSKTDSNLYTTAQIGRFLKACTQRDATARTKASELHAAYCAWCDRHNEVTVGITDNRWGQAIEAAGVEKKRINTGWHYAGLKLLVDGDEQ